MNLTGILDETINPERDNVTNKITSIKTNGKKVGDVKHFFPLNVCIRQAHKILSVPFSVSSYFRTSC